MQKNRQAYAACVRLLRQQKQVFKIDQIPRIVYNNDDYQLAINDKKKLDVKKPEFVGRPNGSIGKTTNVMPERQKTAVRNAVPSQSEIVELLKLIDEQSDSQPTSTNLYADWTGNTSSHQTPAMSISRPADRHSNNQKQKPSGFPLETSNPSSSVAANKNIIKCNYKTGNSEEWENSNLVSDKRIYYILRSMFGLKEFRNNQKAIVKCSLAGNDVFVCMPTGGGKSLTFQLPLVYEPGLTVCIMPLISLIYDQESLSKKLKLKAYTATGNTAAEQLHQFYEQLNNLEDADQGIMLLTTPEKMTASHRLIGAIEQVYHRNLLKRLVIDEAHCVSTWGRDFREDYANLGFLKKKFPRTPVLALTATATEQVKIDVISKLGIEQCYFFQSSFNRSNLFYSVKEKRKRMKEQLVEICRKYSGKSGIVYCTSKKDCEKVSEMLNKQKISAAYYYAGINDNRKREIQEDWMNNKILVIVATIAFGMGINKPDVRFVIHQTMSKSLENYYQESGRAGRDGNPAQCILFYRRSDKNMFMNLNLGNEFATIQSKDFNTKSLLAMVRYGEEKFECRRVFQLHYLGENFSKEQCNKTCDNCQLGRQYREMECLEGAREIVNLLTETSQVRETLTMTQLSLILAGTSNKQLAQKLQFIGRKGIDLDRYNYFRTWKPTQIETLVMSLINEGVLREETYTMNKFTLSELKVDHSISRRFVTQSSYYIKIEVSNKLFAEHSIIEEEAEQEDSEIVSDSSMFEQYAQPKKKVLASRQTSSDDELFEMLESRRSNQLLLKYMTDTVEEEKPNKEQDYSDLLAFLQDG